MSEDVEEVMNHNEGLPIMVSRTEVPTDSHFDPEMILYRVGL